MANQKEENDRRARKPDHKAEAPPRRVQWMRRLKDNASTPIAQAIGREIIRTLIRWALNCDWPDL